ncbi:MAG: hypothetical protein HYW89_00475 [Candidatus Sungiibacteriota bacterium]|uniref:HTH HARE-type domain-containing protein n=1 Tax=Candidatus Sungiibacteriota bacterium TaxID=2750080 RepID=A0A7T5RJR9_9BACT|nr:MAG: hypothetical protein HYW89_00475 [Candidatus Sungbacteria bacterium]
MSNSNLSIKPDLVVKTMMDRLPTRRMRDVLKRRFGLAGRRQTLEAIGKEYKITRERVRQIEADALRHLAKPENIKEAEPVLAALHDHIKEHGGVMAEGHLMATASEAKHYPHVALLLDVGKDFYRVPEDDRHRHRWAVDKDSAAGGEKVISGVVRDLEKIGKPVTRVVLYDLISRNAKEVLRDLSVENAADSFLKTSKIIHVNPYGEFGLVSWSTINPRGVRDKAYLVLAKSGNPLHFREVAEGINKAGWSKRKAHPQTVHNELIKDKRFVLVGRGLYALREWGYEPGVVRDVLASVLKSAGRPLSKDAIIRMVLEKRLVKQPTILLNLQNKSLFKRTDDGKYTLV